MLKTPTEIYIEPKSRLNTIIDEIPTNSILWKWFTDLGATTLELTNWRRSSIIIIPDKDASTEKMREMLADEEIDYPYSLVVNGSTPIQEIKQYLQDTTNEPRKILTTANSLYKITDECELLGIDWRNEFFALFDEYHTIITDFNFRDILYEVASETLVQFAKSAMMSATPVVLTDPVFSKYQVYHVKLTKPINRPIDVIIAKNILPTAVRFIKEHVQTSKEEEIICVFINSVSAISNIMNHLTMEQRAMSSIFCANNAVNISNLDIFADNIKKDTTAVTKINFFTQCFNHCWSLKHVNPTMVYLTDTHSPYSHQNIKFYGVQSLGRARGEKKRLYHITNTKAFYHGTRPESELAIENMNRAMLRKLNSNAELMQIEHEPIQEQQQYITGRVELNSDYIKFNDDTDEFEISHGAVGRLTIEKAGNQQYLNEQTIKKAWQEHYFNPSISHRTDNWTKQEIELAKGKKSVAVKNKAVFDNLETFSNSPIGSENYKEFQKLKLKFKVFSDYLDILGYETIAKTNFDIPRIKHICQAKKIENKLNNPKVKEAIKAQLKLNTPYLRPQIKNPLCEIFKEAGVTTRDVKPTALTILHFCEIKEIKRLPGTPRGKKDHAIKIIRFKEKVKWPGAEVN